MPFDGLNYARSRISAAALKARLANQANSTGPKPFYPTRKQRALMVKNRALWLHDYRARLGAAEKVLARDQFAEQ